MAVRAPDNQRRAGDAALAEFGLVHLEIDANGGAVILAHRVNLFGRGAADVFGHGLWREDLQPDALLVELVLDVIVQIGAQQLFRKRRLLGHEEPVIGLQPPAQADVGKHVMGRHDVERAQPLNPFGLVQRHAEAHAPAPVVAGDHEAVVSQLVHQLEVVLAHGAEAVAGVVRPAVGLGAVAVAAQVRRDQREMPGQVGRHLVPADMGQRVAVQQQERRLKRQCRPSGHPRRHTT
jgi:hypothetical protein